LRSLEIADLAEQLLGFFVHRAILGKSLRPIGQSHAEVSENRATVPHPDDDRKTNRFHSQHVCA
jgi:hypothetical protein